MNDQHVPITLALVNDYPVVTQGIARMLEDFDRLLAAEAASGRVVQVGFQSLGSDTLALFASDGLGIGPVTRVGAVGAWSRPLAYWRRSPWAGHRSLDGREAYETGERLPS